MACDGAARLIYHHLLTRIYIHTRTENTHDRSEKALELTKAFSAAICAYMYMVKYLRRLRRRRRRYPRQDTAGGRGLFSTISVWRRRARPLDRRRWTGDECVPRGTRGGGGGAESRQWFLSGISIAQRKDKWQTVTDDDDDAVSFRKSAAELNVAVRRRRRWRTEGRRTRGKKKRTNKNGSWAILIPAQPSRGE